MAFNWLVGEQIRASFSSYMQTLFDVLQLGLFSEIFLSQQTVRKSGAFGQRLGGFERCRGIIDSSLLLKLGLVISSVVEHFKLFVVTKAFEVTEDGWVVIDADVNLRLRVLVRELHTILAIFELQDLDIHLDIFTLVLLGLLSFISRGSTANFLDEIASQA